MKKIGILFVLALLVIGLSPIVEAKNIRLRESNLDTIKLNGEDYSNFKSSLRLYENSRVNFKSWGVNENGYFSFRVKTKRIKSKYYIKEDKRGENILEIPATIVVYQNYVKTVYKQDVKVIFDSDKVQITDLNEGEINFFISS